jgi:hypothetical protein
MNFGFVAGGVSSAAGGLPIAAGTGKFVDAAPLVEAEVACVLDPLLLLPQPAPIIAIDATAATVQTVAGGRFGCFMVRPSSCVSDWGACMARTERGGSSRVTRCRVPVPSWK